MQIERILIIRYMNFHNKKIGVWNLNFDKIKGQKSIWNVVHNYMEEELWRYNSINTFMALGY